MYGYRMHDALAEDYPAVRALLGHERFAKFVSAYLAQFPSRSPSLQDLSLHVPLFLATASVPRRAMLADVARVELAILRAQLAPNVEPLSRERAAAFPPEQWPEARLVLAPHVQRLVLDFDASSLVTAARRGETLPSFRARSTCTLAWRKDWIVWRRDVDAGTFAFLEALARGSTLTVATRAARRAHAASSNDVSELDARLQTAFGEWLGEGFFTDVRATSTSARRSARRS